MIEFDLLLKKNCDSDSIRHCWSVHCDHVLIQ